MRRLFTLFVADSVPESLAVRHPDDFGGSGGPRRVTRGVRYRRTMLCLLAWVLVASVEHGAAVAGGPPAANVTGGPRPATPPTHLSKAAVEVLLFDRVNVITMAGPNPEVLLDQRVVVRDGQIVQIGATRSIPKPAGARVIRGRGRYLLPGLADMHTHVSYSRRYGEAERADTFLIYLANGVTTIYDLGAFDGVLDWRDELSRGEILGPRLFSSSRSVDNRNAADPDVMELLVREAEAAGHDAIKMYHTTNLTSYLRALDVARSVGIPVLGHGPRGGIPYETLLSNDQVMIAHAQEVLHMAFGNDQSAEHFPDFPRVAKQTAKAGKWLTATLTIFENIARLVDPVELQKMRNSIAVRHLPQQMSADWEANAFYLSPAAQGTGWDDPVWLRERLDFQARLTKEMNDAGVRLMMGTDSGVEYTVVGFSMLDEMRRHVEAGISTYDVLRAATYNAADFLGLLDELGTVEVGKTPDLVLVKGNPIEKLDRMARVEGVLVRGQWVGKKTLKAALRQIRARYAAARGARVSAEVELCPCLREHASEARAASRLRR